MMIADKHDSCGINWKEQHREKNLTRKELRSLTLVLTNPHTGIIFAVSFIPDDPSCFPDGAGRPIPTPSWGFSNNLN